MTPIDIRSRDAVELNTGVYLSSLDYICLSKLPSTTIRDLVMNDDPPQ